MRPVGILCAVALLLGSAQKLEATLYNVQIDTSALAGTPGAIAFDFTSSKPSDNFVNILNFSHDGLTGLPETRGGLVSGDIILGLNPAPATRIEDDSFFNSLVLPFDSFGTVISFAVQISENAPPPAEIPDEFSFFVLGSDGLPLLPTLDTLGSNALFTICVDGSGPGVLSVFAPAMLTGADEISITFICAPTRLVSAQVITQTATFSACTVLTVTDTQILGGDITFLAGEAVVIGDDFIAGFDAGGQLSIAIDASLIP